MINLTQHTATADQRTAGVEDLQGAALLALQNMLTFAELPSASDIEASARAIASIAVRAKASQAMIGGAPYLMGPLTTALWNVGITPMFAFSLRRSVDEPQPDGSVRKVAVFCHAGFVEACREGKQP